MAVEQLSAAPCAPYEPPHPMANPGYGKRSAPDQRPRDARDFSHLPPREAAVAAYIDRLPDGSDISVKTLAKWLPYGQCALRTSLNRLQAAGHLRRGGECLATDTVMLWVTRTFFSRTARDDDWWAAFTRGDVPQEPQRPTRSRAFVLLAALGRTAPSLSLSAADCLSLEPLVAEWFERGATETETLRALTHGLPSPVHHAASLVRRRLVDKLPPERHVPGPSAVVLRALECGECRAPGSPEALRGGLCGVCRGEAGAGVVARPPGTVPMDGVPQRMASVRAGLVPRSGRTVHARGITRPSEGGVRAGAGADTGRTPADADATGPGADRS
ncbi:hypothetical protein OG206_14670 [Streptomyces sp. NBC_01341]|uniref:hypothetical protein n=1 Tax=Streptomyces sp. NBC_01341 TaxID=2903831 RepID=UPI002E15AB4A|nr:hypothetical protein OG206_14670 [Streptomyces sp. NBC_01341]